MKVVLSNDGHAEPTGVPAFQSDSKQQRLRRTTACVEEYKAQGMGGMGKGKGGFLNLPGALPFQHKYADQSESAGIDPSIIIRPSLALFIHPSSITKPSFKHHPSIHPSVHPCMHACIHKYISTRMSLHSFSY